MLKHLICILIISQAIYSSGQDRQMSYDSLEYPPLVKFPVASINYSQYSSSEVKNNPNDSEVGMSELSTSISWAVGLKKEKLFFLNGFDLTKFNFDVRDNQQFRLNENMYSLALRAGLIYKLTKRWTLVGIITPTLASNMKTQLNEEDFILQSAFFATKRANRYLEYGFGLSFNSRFGRELLVPLVSLSHRKGDWGIYSVFPGFASSFYHFRNGDGHIGLTAALFGNLYNFTNTLTNVLELNQVGYSRLHLGPEFQWKLYGDLFLNLQTGVVLINKLETINSDNEVELDLSANHKFFFRIGLNILK